MSYQLTQSRTRGLTHFPEKIYIWNIICNNYRADGISVSGSLAGHSVFIVFWFVFRGVSNSLSSKIVQKKGVTFFNLNTFRGICCQKTRDQENEMIIGNMFFFFWRGGPKINKMWNVTVIFFT